MSTVETMNGSKIPHIQYVGDNIPDVENFINHPVEVDDQKGDFLFFNGRIGFNVNLGDYIVNDGGRFIIMPPAVFEKMYMKD